MNMCNRSQSAGSSKAMLHPCLLEHHEIASACRQEVGAPLARRCDPCASRTGSLTGTCWIDRPRAHDSAATSPLILPDLHFRRAVGQVALPRSWIAPRLCLPDAAGINHHLFSYVLSPGSRVSAVSPCALI